jgi:hypothetical protein
MIGSEIFNDDMIMIPQKNLNKCTELSHLKKLKVDDKTKAKEKNIAETEKRNLLLVVYIGASRVTAKLIKSDKTIVGRMLDKLAQFSLLRLLQTIRLH